MVAVPSAPPPAGEGPVPELPEDPWLGRVVGGRYRLLQRLGAGGMGTVYSAEHMTLQKQVALKLVHEDTNADHAKRFVREAMVTSRIDHPNVISALDFGSFEDGTAYLTMQLVEGPTLSNLCSAEGCLPWVRAAEIGAQIADALVAAQAHGIVHRDLKPDNVILQLLDDGTELVKVLDFGIAKYTRDSLAPPPVRGTHAVTRVGAVVGTPGYMAPEQAVGKRADHRADLYSLGVLLWESVVGHRLWDHDDLQKLLGAQLSRPAPSVRETSQDFTIPDSFDQLVARLLAQDANERPSSAALVRDELRELVLAVKQGVLHSPKPAGRSPSPPPLFPPEAATEPWVKAAGADSPKAGAPEDVPAPADPTRVIRLRGKAARTSTPGSESLPTAPSAAVSAPAPLRPPRVKLALALGAGAILLASSAWLGLHGHPARASIRSAASPKPKIAVASVAAAPAAAPSALADPVRDELRTLIEGGSREERVSSAQALLRHVPIEDVPTYARAMARLQLAETCPQKKAELGLFQTLDDPRTLPTLVALAQRKRGGCGHRGHEDCLSCLRDELAQLIRRLETKQAEQHR